MGYESLEYRRTNLFHPNVEILCSKSEKTTKYLCGLYYEKLKKDCFQDQKIFLFLDSWAGQIDTKFGNEKTEDNVNFVIISANTKKYLQPLDISFFPRL